MTNGKYYKDDLHPRLSHTEYKISEERVMLVRNYDGEDWKKRVFIKKVDEEYMCWFSAETLEESKKERFTFRWRQMKELEEETLVELTLEDISNGKGVGVAPHLIRIKK